MKGNRRGQPPVASQPPPASPTTKGTAKYTNKDGSKFITVPKIAPTPEPQPSPTVTSANAGAKSSNGSQESATSANPAPVNRKKAKRRAKAAAKAAAEQAAEGHTNGVPGSHASHEHGSAEVDDSDDDGAEENSVRHTSETAGGEGQMGGAKSKKSKKKKKKATEESQLAGQQQPSPSLAQAQTRTGGLSREKIWNTSSQEERERIKEFWLGLGEDERKSLVKVEKDAVLKKMKEQQKHTCSCTVCGRKRTAIEEELEGLYDAYYHELEQYAHDPHRSEQGPPLLGSSRRQYVSMRGNLHSQPSQGYMQHGSEGEDDLEGEEEYSDEDDLDDEAVYSEVEEEEEEELSSEELHHQDYATDFFNFGKSLTVQGGILTVADDLLKNDGKKFIEMMEQLAERRMAREEDAKDQYRSPDYGHGVNGNYPDPHDHPPTEEDDYEVDDEEEDEEYDSQDDYEDEVPPSFLPSKCPIHHPHHDHPLLEKHTLADTVKDLEEEAKEAKTQPPQQDTMTDAQRMEEGRRMFQIFAARMFEQRVLTAYREKVAKERQDKLLEELDEESRQDSQRKAKKAKDAQKKKEKAQQKKQALAEEKARKEAEKAAEEERRLAEEARKAEEQRLRAEEKRKKKEAQRKAEEEERLRKEAERQRRIHEQKERQAEQERKAREAKDREKKAREEAKLKEQEARDRKEREARERKDNTAKVKATNEAAQKPRPEPKTAPKPSGLPNPAASIVLPKRPSQQASTVPALPQQPPATAFASPQIAVATPAIPKAPTPIRPRQSSQQDASTAGSTVASQSGSGPSQNPSPNPTTPAQSSPGPAGHPSHLGLGGPASLSHISTASPTQAQSNPGHHPSGPYQQLPPLAGMPFPMHIPTVQPPPGFFNSLGGGGYRAPGPPTMGMAMPPGIHPPSGRTFSPHLQGPPPGFSQPPHGDLHGMNPFAPSPKDQLSGVPSPQSRKQSTSFDTVHSRPTPIGRPGSVVHGFRQASTPPSSMALPDDLQDPNSVHLGSKALLDDSVDEPADRYMAQGIRPAYPTGPGNLNDTSPFVQAAPIWGHSVPQQGGPGGPFGPATNMGFNSAVAPPSWGPVNSVAAPFGGVQVGLGRNSASRITRVRQMLCQACKELSAAENGPEDGDGFVPLDRIKNRVDMMFVATGENFVVSEDELLDMCDTEGNAMNGGGNFDVRHTAYPKLVRWNPAMSRDMHQPPRSRAPGEIGSPLVGSVGEHNSIWGGSSVAHR